jgi:hypothetical protein
MAQPDIRVVLEVGKYWTFARAVDWPGWCRRGKGTEAALEALDAYRVRYGRAVHKRIPASALRVVGESKGSRTTDFGAPASIDKTDFQKLAAAESRSWANLVTQCWESFDGIVDRSPQSLAKGPRGGGRDRDAIVDHVREAERAYARKWGVRLPPRTPWDEQRSAITEQLLALAPDGKPSDPKGWPVRYGAHRIAWHVLDHAWEIEDRH